MVNVDIPGYGQIVLAHLVLDYNGTLAVDGAMLPGVRRRLRSLASRLHIHVLTADTFGKAAGGLGELDCRLTVLAPEAQDLGKRDFVCRLGADKTASIGNGRNDALMLEASALGMAVILAEGACVKTLTAADMVFTDICDALDILQNPLRLTATLRS